MEPVILIVGAIVLFPVLSLVVMYNRFVRQCNLVDSSWGGVDVELKRRHELIPNLVTTVQGYAAHERTLLESLVRAREQATGHLHDDPAERQSFEEQVGRALGTVLARVEGYPELKASAHFLRLQEELTHTEDRIAAARRFYNNNVGAYNTRVQTFPSNLVARVFGFGRRQFFELTGAREASVPPVAG